MNKELAIATAPSRFSKSWKKSDDDMGRTGSAARNPGENRGDYVRVPRHEEVRAR